MPPKKAAEQEKVSPEKPAHQEEKPSEKPAQQEKIPLGRPGNNLKSGIVGIANVGKSTLFQAITKSKLGNPANFPYATIDPEEAKVVVPDERFDWLCEHYKQKSNVPANLTVYDIAGLTRGASTGAGLGNSFLSHIRAVDAIYHVVRTFSLFYYIPTVELQHWTAALDCSCRKWSLTVNLVLLHLYLSPTFETFIVLIHLINIQRCI